MIKKLKWDSEFFGYDVGKVVIEENQVVSEQELIKESYPFKLVYIFSDIKLDFKHFKSKLVDIKTTFYKKQLAWEENPEFIHCKDEPAACNNLRQLALESGVFSRFKRDNNFTNNEFEKLYSQWINDSIKKINADHIIVYKENNICKGFVSLKFQKEIAEIGLMAVDEDSRGEGIGLTLLGFINNLSRSKGFPEMRVTTQFENIPAMQLYEKAGYTILSKQYIYHLWN